MGRLYGLIAVCSDLAAICNPHIRPAENERVGNEALDGALATVYSLLIVTIL